jgi:hypothetical protein
MNENAANAGEGMLGRASMIKKPMRCGTRHCGRPAACLVESRFLCVDHFIAHCYTRLEQCGEGPFGERGGRGTESDDEFIEQCCCHAAVLAHTTQGLDNLERARLFDILLWASEISARREVFRPRRLAASG